MSLVLLFLRWLFGRRLSAVERHRAWAVDMGGWLLEQLEEGWFAWEAPEHRTWLLRHVKQLERAAFWWGRRHCARLGTLMAGEPDVESLLLRICEALKVLLGPKTGPIRGKGCKIRKGRKFLHRKRLIAWRVKRRRMRVRPLRAARDPPAPPHRRLRSNCLVRRRRETFRARAPALAYSPVWSSAWQSSRPVLREVRLRICQRLSRFTRSQLP